MRDLDLNRGLEIHKFINKKEFTNPNHSHPYYEFLYIRNASFNYLIGEEIITPVNNSIILVNENTIHKAVYANSDTNNYTIIKFYKLLIDSTLQEDLKRLFQNRLLKIPQNDIVLVDMLIAKIHREFRENNHNSLTMLKLQLNELIEYFYRLSLNSDSISSKSKLTITEQAISYINSNLTSIDHTLLTLDKISSRYHMSACSFSRLFKKEAGIGFKEYILSAKILHAKKLLASSNLPITEIAYLSGFSDSNYFASVFKKHESVTPSEYSKFIKNYH